MMRVIRHDLAFARRCPDVRWPLALLQRPATIASVFSAETGLLRAIIAYKSVKAGRGVSGGGVRETDGMSQRG